MIEEKATVMRGGQKCLCFLPNQNDQGYLEPFSRFGSHRNHDTPKKSVPSCRGALVTQPMLRPRAVILTRANLEP